jgi:uncharacterized protein (DUF1697 family)
MNFAAVSRDECIMMAGTDPRGYLSLGHPGSVGFAQRKENTVAGRFVALLRGINVGTAKRVAMAELRAMVEELGYRAVSTLLNSGNVVFTAQELSEVVAANPLGKVAGNPSRLLVGILGDAADREKLGVICGKDWGKERIALGDKVTSRNWATMLKLRELAGEGGG